MKLKGFGNRAYNIFFHLHTVSGIVISVALFVIFFAGAFTLFKTEFYLWENPRARKGAPAQTNPEEILKKVREQLAGFDLDDDTFITFPTASHPVINLYGHIKPESGEGEIHYAGKMNPGDSKLYETAESAVGETLYRLHFLDQIPYAGRWLAGFTSLFFVFASITGLLVHWKNMLTKFWALSFKGARKQIWTNSHTVLGLLGLPYQLMYAVTGAFYLLLILVLMPAVMVLYEGKPEHVYALAYPAYGVAYDDDAPPAVHTGRLAALHERVMGLYGKDYDILAVQLRHFNKEDAAVNYRLVARNSSFFSSHGYVGYRLADGSEIYSELPGEGKKLTYKVIEAFSHLHFATFGGMFVKGIYFVMALFTCYVIVSGILIWKEARNNRNYTPKQKKFHHRVTLIFLSVCFSLFPAIALLFTAEMALQGIEDHTLWVNTVFFTGWLALAMAGFSLKTEKKLTWFCLFTGGLLSVTVPVANGLVTGDWLWHTMSVHIWATDLFWLLTGILCLALSVGGRKPADSVPDDSRESRRQLLRSAATGFRSGI